MDPVSALGLISSCVAIFDGLKDAYRFGRDVIKADIERVEFDQRLDYVKTVITSLNTLIESEKLHPGPASTALLDLEMNATSPLKGVASTIVKMNAMLKTKETEWKRQLKRLEWRSEKKTLDHFFTELEGFCTGILAILSTASINLSNSNYTLAQETNLITKTLALKLEEDRIENKKIQLEKEIRRSELEKKEIENWLSPFNYQARRSEKIENAARTGQWFIDSPEFKNWKDGQVQLLRCYGPTGAGKTILSAIVADHLIQHLKPKTPALSIFFEQKSTSQTPTNILGSLLKQLVQMKDGRVSPGIKAAYDKAIRIRAKVTLKEMETLFEAELETYDQVFIIVDALDEAPDESLILIERYVRPLYPEKIKLMLTRRRDVESSRDRISCNVCLRETPFWYQCINCPQGDLDRTDICQKCWENSQECPMSSTHKLRIPKVFEKVIQTPDSDLASYIEFSIQKEMPEDLSEDDPSPSHGSSSKLGRECQKNPALLAEIVKAIVRASQGRFLLAKQYIRSLGSKQNLGAIKKSLRELAKDRYSLAESIDLLYAEDMEIRIRGQEPEKARSAMQILAVVFTACRNLTFKELQHALATWEVGETTEYDADFEMERQEVLNRTKGLIRIDQDSEGVVRFDHSTLERFFESNRTKYFPNSHTDMSRICLSYLMFDEFSKPCYEIEEFSVKEQSHCFISYAVQYWGDHLRESTLIESGDEEVVKSAVAYLQSPPRLEAYIQAAWASSTFEHDKWDVRRSIDPLHVCAWFNLAHLISALDYQKIDLDVREKTYGQTALMYACRRGHADVARRLLELGASVNLVSGKGRNRTALLEAVLNKHETLVELLLSPEFEVVNVDANVPSTKHFNRTPLMIAAHRGQVDTVRKLLNHRMISLNHQDLEGNTALHLATQRGHTEVVSALLEADGIDVDIQEKRFGRTALLSASEKNHLAIVKMLADRGANPQLKDMRGGYAFLRAAEEGCVEALTLLASYSVNAGQTDEDGCTPLHLASGNGHVKVLEIIADQYDAIDVRDKIGMTPLHRACISGKLEAAEVLIQKGANVCLEDNYSRTPIAVAWQYGHENLTSLCRSSHITSSLLAEPKIEDLPLWSLVVRREIALVEAALSSRPETLELKEHGTENTVLHSAIIQRTEDEDWEVEVTTKLLELLLPVADSCLDELDNCGRSPLHLAVQFGNAEAVKILLEHDPEINKPDRFGLTPLSIAFGDENYPIAIMLVEAGADIESSKIDTQKLLFKAIELRNVKAAEFLVNAGADATIPDEFGRTVTQLAKLSGESRLMHLAQSIKSSVWQIKRAQTKAGVSASVEVVEILSEITADQFPAVNHLPIRNLYDSTVTQEREAIAIYA